MDNKKRLLQLGAMLECGDITRVAMMCGLSISYTSNLLSGRNSGKNGRADKLVAVLEAFVKDKYEAKLRALRQRLSDTEAEYANLFQ